jgi:type II restriction/modification system DNA methylase subunit YeeA
MHFDDEGASAKTKKRREFGAHYTSEANILKVIRPLFLDSLTAEFNKIRRNKKPLQAFHEKLATLNFFDPACGCGNFLVIAYRELRLLELEVIEALWGHQLSGHLNVDTLIRCNVDQFHGIEIDESAAQIATVALWLTDHQMNLKVQRFGLYYNRIPLIKKANIICANALQIDWAEVISPGRCSYIMGNPPFIGKKEQSRLQKADMELLVSTIKGAGVLDYVTAWYIKATAYIKSNPTVPVAFVSTNSICQGEQVGILWSYLLAQGVKIHFAHRTFRWSNEGRGVAAVHCVIIGFGLKEAESYHLFDYAGDIKGVPIEFNASRINPYLVDAPSIIIENRKSPINNAPELSYGSFALDAGHYTLTKLDVDKILRHIPMQKNTFVDLSEE